MGSTFLVATVAAVSPALMVFGAGTAHAGVAVNVNPAPGGVDVWLTTWPDNPGDSAPSGWCKYNSSVAGDPWGKPAPAINVPFYLPVKPTRTAVELTPGIPELSDRLDMEYHGGMPQRAATVHPSRLVIEW